MEELPSGSDDSSRPSGRELVPVPEKVAAVYQRQRGWMEKVEPETFLELSGAGLRTEEGRPGGAGRWAALVLVGLVLATGVTFERGDWRIKNYLVRLFHHPVPAESTALEDFPGELKESEMPAGLRVALQEINRAQRARQWPEAVRLTEEMLHDRRNADLLWARPAAWEWAYEVLVADRVFQKDKSQVEQALAEYEQYRRQIEPRAPSFRLRYAAVCARFLRLGGTGGIGLPDDARRAAQAGLLQELNQLEDEYGKLITEVPERRRNLRVIRVYTLARFLSGLPKENLLGAENASSEAAHRFDELREVLDRWETEAGAEVAKWPPELKYCHRWFWEQASAYARNWVPLMKFGSVQIGKYTYTASEAWKHATLEERQAKR